jgi:hypothetical protein
MRLFCWHRVTALSLRERVDLEPERRYRLVGIGLSNFRPPEEISAHQFSPTEYHPFPITNCRREQLALW